MEKLKIVAIGYVYNEIEYIKYKHMWAIQQDVDLYVIDNMSTDGTWEYLQENNIPSHRFNTQNKFNIVTLQKELVNTLHKLKPDWYIWNGCDTFRYTKNGLRNDIEFADSQGYDSLTLTLIDIKNTGEKKEKNKSPFHTYFYGNIVRDQTTIGKYNKDIKLHGDNIKSFNKKNILFDGVLVNYGMTKSVKEREETYNRRQLAWKKDGLRKDFGGHYKQASLKKWVWKKEEVKDIRLTGYGYFFPAVQYLTHMLFSYKPKINKTIEDNSELDLNFKISEKKTLKYDKK